MVSLHFWTWSSVALAKPPIVGKAGQPPGEALTAACLGQEQLMGQKMTWSLRGGLANPCPPWPHVATTRREAQPEGRMPAAEVVHPGWRARKRKVAIT